ncbi:unnamed protein product [marine sediment metagenome]|uniref:Uncharacterized protein n=1 Tax=marine sediment metagenome TaxID=412755 RepID=X0Y8T5_9ZZZZ
MILIGIWEQTMRNVLDKAEPEKKQIAEVHCGHYWIIETPDGPISRGVCKYCGTVKEFRNYLPHSSWEEDRSMVGELSSSTRHKSGNKSDA